ncbi:MAG: hypothetical protein J6O88_15135 [Chryseobacterium sp.]|uniref:hypothetical protein n=1 Tax=Chryseobacterium sp. TaxID=1871047 RepID=UPI001B2489CE|nr:hypothetical protein [Chryseobacterium sp.]MBO6185992.1 hypothetical protein [Chryseobacterium sp.]
MEDSKSLFIFLNNTKKQQLDADGNPLNGTRIYAEDFKNGKQTLLRYIDGYLDGDLFDTKGNLVMQRPAVDADGHQEYWRKNRLHRDGNAPAIYSKGFTEEEWWQEGKRIR